MSAVSVTIGADTAQFDSAINGLSGKVNKASSQMASSFGNAGASISRSLANIGAVAGFSMLIKRGFDFNKTMGDSESAIAKVLSQFQGLNDEAAKQEAGKAMQQLIELEPQAAGSLSDLVQGFMATLAASQSAGLSVSENIDLVGRFANALANAAIPTEQLAQEMRSIVTGNIGADSSLAKVLSITNDMVKSARESGTLYEFLTQKIGKLGESGDTAAVTFSTLSSAIDSVTGAFTKGLFDEAIGGAKDLTAAVNENKDTFIALGAAVGDVVSGVSKGIKVIAENASAMIDLMAALKLKMETGLSFEETWSLVKKSKEGTSTQPDTTTKPKTPADFIADAPQEETAKRLLQISRQETEVAMLKASGQEEAAKQMERQIKHAQELIKIQGLEISQSDKGKLIGEAGMRFAAESQQIAAAPIIEELKKQLNEQAGKLSKNAGDLSRAAFSPLKGDMDVSYGRGSSINPLTSGASAQIQQMMKQSALLKQQADKIDKSNSLLGDIAAAVKTFNPKLSYN